MNVDKLSDATVKELHDVMDRRRKSCAQNPKEEAEYETQSEDWQKLFGEIKKEMTSRGFLDAV